MEYCSNNAYIEFWCTVMWKWANIMPRKKDKVERRYDVKLYEVTLCLVRHNFDILKLRLRGGMVRLRGGMMLNYMR